MVTALIIAAMIQLGIISDSTQYSDSLYQSNQAQVEIIIDEEVAN
jgi:hypothetical protein